MAASVLRLALRSLKSEFFFSRTAWRGSLFRGRWADGASAGSRALNCGRNFREVLIGKLQRGWTNPAIDLLRSSRAHDCAGHAGPRERPGNCYGRDRSVVALCNRPQGVSQREIAAQIRFLKGSRTPSPIILSEVCDSVARKAIRQQARLHRAIANHAGVVARAPGNLVGGDSTIDQ